MNLFNIKIFKDIIISLIFIILIFKFYCFFNLCDYLPGDKDIVGENLGGVEVATVGGLQYMNFDLDIQNKNNTVGFADSVNYISNLIRDTDYIQGMYLGYSFKNFENEVLGEKNYYKDIFLGNEDSSESKNLGDDVISDDVNDTDDTLKVLSDNVAKFSGKFDNFLGFLKDDPVKWEELMDLMQKFYNKKRQEIRKKMVVLNLREPFFMDQDKSTVNLGDDYIVDMKGDNVKYFLDNYSMRNSSDWNWACIRFCAREFLFALTAFGDDHVKISKHLKNFFEGNILESTLKNSLKLKDSLKDPSK